MSNQILKNRIISAIETDSIDTLIVELEQEGYQRQDVLNVIKEIKQEAMDQAYQEARALKREDDYQQAGFIIVFMLSLVTGFFNIEDKTLIYLFAVVCGVAGFMCFRRSPLAGCIASIVAYFLFNYTYLWYISGRTRIIKIEILVPMIIAAIPSVILYLILAVIFKSKKEVDPYE